MSVREEVEDEVAGAPRLSSDYWRFWWAASLSNLGDGVRLAALPLLAVRLTDEPVAVAAVGALIFLPWVLLGPFLGVLVDRVDRRHLMIVGQLARGALLTMFAVAIAADHASMPLLYVVAFLVGTGEVAVDTASQAAIPTLAPKSPGGLEVANSRLIASQTVLNDVVGPPVGAFLFIAAASLPFFLDAASFALGVSLLLTVRRPLQSERLPEHDPVLTELKVGFSVLWRNPFLRQFAIGVGLVNLCLSAAGGMLVFLALDDLDLSEAGFGYLLGAGAIGGVAGSLLSSRISRVLGQARSMVTAIALVALGITLLGFAPNVWWAIALQFVVMASVVVFNVIGMSVRQAITPERILGRIVATSRVLSTLGIPVGALTGGVIASLTSVRTTFVVAGIATLVPLVVIVKAARHVQAEPELISLGGST